MPVSILTGPIALPVFVGTALLFLRLVATEHLDRFHAWGSRVEEPAPSRCYGTLWSVSIVAVVAALLVAPLVPVTDLLDDTPGGDGPGGASSGYQLTVGQPVHPAAARPRGEDAHPAGVRRDEGAVDVVPPHHRARPVHQTTSGAPRRATCPSDNRADGVFPNPPGLAPGVGGTEDDWSFEFAPNFSSTWLPLPYPIRELDIDGSWRYDSRTLDVAFVGGGQPQELEYSATVVHARRSPPSCWSPQIDGRPRRIAGADDRGPGRPAGRDQRPGHGR